MGKYTKNCFISMLLLATALMVSCKKTGGSDGPVTPVDPSDTLFRFASYNILVNDGRRTEMALDKCRNCFSQVFSECDADIICFNEIDATFATQLPSIASGIKNYIWDIANPNKVVDASTLEYYYSNGLAYNSKKFKLVSRGMYWYLKDGTYTSDRMTAYSSHVPKSCTLVWTKLKHINSSRQLCVISTHFPLSTDGESSGYKTGEAHKICATALNSFVQNMSMPCIVGADFNSSTSKTDANAAGHAILLQKWTDAYDYLKAQGKLNQTYITYCGTMSGSSAKYHYDVDEYTKDHPERRIDHIMYRNAQTYSVVPRSYKSIMTGYKVSGESFCPSDHLPIVVEFVLR